MVENAYRHVSEADTPYEQQPQVILTAAKQVGRPIFFSLAIIIVSFAPVFLLEAQEGRMFRPLAFTKTFAMVFASLLSITLVPVLMTVFIRGRRLRPETANPVSRFFAWLYAPVLRLALPVAVAGPRGQLCHRPADGAAAVWHRQRVHAPALRGLDALHAHRATRSVGRGGDSSPAGAGQGAPAISRGRAGLRHGRAGDHIDRQFAHGDGQHKRSR